VDFTETSLSIVDISHGLFYSCLKTHLFSKSSLPKKIQSFIKKRRVLVDSDVLNVPVIPVSDLFLQVNSMRKRNCSYISVTAVTHVISISCSAHWGVPVWYFSGRKCWYDLYPSREVLVWHTVSYCPTSSTDCNTTPRMAYFQLR